MYSTTTVVVKLIVVVYICCSVGAFIIILEVDTPPMIICIYFILYSTQTRSLVRCVHREGDTHIYTRDDRKSGADSWIRGDCDVNTYAHQAKA